MPWILNKTINIPFAHRFIFVFCPFANISTFIRRIYYTSLRGALYVFRLILGFASRTTDFEYWIRLDRWASFVNCLWSLYVLVKRTPKKMAQVHYMKNSEWTLIKGTKTKRMVRVIDSMVGFYILSFICHVSQCQNNNNKIIQQIMQ